MEKSECVEVYYTLFDRAKYIYIYARNIAPTLETKRAQTY